MIIAKGLQCNLHHGVWTDAVVRALPDPWFDAVVEALPDKAWVVPVVEALPLRPGLTQLLRLCPIGLLTRNTVTRPRVTGKGRYKG